MEFNRVGQYIAALGNSLQKEVGYQIVPQCRINYEAVRKFHQRLVETQSINKQKENNNYEESHDDTDSCSIHAADR